jgi:hypothetical protein
LAVSGLQLKRAPLGGVMRTTVAVTIAVVAVGCAHLPEDPFNLCWDPDRALMSHSANECWLKVRSLVDNGDVMDEIQRQRADIQACISALPESDRLVVFFDSPNGNPIHRELTSTPDGIPVERIRASDGWEYVRLPSGIAGWVQDDMVALLYLQ